MLIADKPSTPPTLPQPLEELEEATKAIINRGKRKVKKVQKKVIDAGKHVLGTAVADDKASESDPSDVAEEEAIATVPLPAISERVECPKMERQNADQQFLPQTDPPSTAATPATPSVSVSTTGSISTAMILTIYTSIVAAYHACACKSAILANQLPLSAVFPLVVVAFLLGYNIDGVLSLFLKKGEHPLNTSGGEANRHTRKITQRRRGGVYHVPTDDVDSDIQTSLVNTDEEINDENNNQEIYVSRTRQLVRRGRVHIRRFGRTYFKPYVHLSSQSEGGHSISRAASGISSRAKFWSNLHHQNVKEWEKKLTAPFAEGPLMDHLLKYSDFSRHKSSKETAAAKKEVDTVVTEDGSEETKIEAVSEVGKITDISMGKAKLNNAKAESLGADGQFSHIVDPICELRGMDLFLTDAPEEQIWRQPLLNHCGLRDTPTLVSNMMMPFGNMTAYFKLPDWVDDFDNIPEEKDDDPSEVKALKRFLMGDDEYRNSRAKLIPYVVDGPLAIRLIKPKPVEVRIDGPRHPATWEKKPKSVDPSTGKIRHPLLEVDIDLISANAVRKIINLIRPHLHSITIDLAFIISQPKGSEIEEPSACVGLWRIDKVDFESCAVFPEKTIDEAAEELKMYVSLLEEENLAVEAAAAAC
mmetsp:Transcript_20625/g.44801  ORF Transcript_20625/g.44801 Transcript_20625/m.44801 type:complete len:644 (+) Transcript_20625:229-2160(+)|eukprot:CAMPEP_0172313824 /NCGR_PEP_ID=MMETSP1058-20130122/21067_1 /TAXON_ID=83371 /ORGANISM="Detonula confervacea, Strain CCMP 353" /LENGTH=643 /DNA_ID=CAMNT_0013027541 /DNA_START=154 /DNA_END=2085 /DNA_ORIENTATION=+